jgi:hypothetical protein
MLTMCHLRTSTESLEMAARVARKLFATIRYRFSHLDNGLNCKTAYGQVGRSGRMGNVMKTRWLTMGLSLSWNLWVPVVVAD